MQRFVDRADAGRRLADHLAEEGWAERDSLVLALPRGGVEVAAPVADRLGAPLDVLVVRKIGAPGHEEFAIGAVGEGGPAIRSEDVVRRLRLTDQQWEQLVEQEREEVRRRVEAYRGGRPPVEVTGRHVLVVDDGVATGATAAAALRVVRGHDPAWLALAVPVASPAAVAALSEEADEVIALQEPADFFAVGQFYARFDQTSDQQVIDLLASSR